MIRTYRRLLIIIAAAQACDNAVQNRPNEPVQATTSVIELRVGRDEPEAGFHMWDENGDLYVENRSIVSDLDIEDARASVGTPGLRVELWLTEDGARRLEQATKENVGQRIAVVINGELIAAPRIMEPLRLEALDRHVTFGGADVPTDKARSVAEDIASRWPEKAQKDIQHP